MKINIKKELILVIATLIPLIYLAVVWNDLPNEIATHFNFEGEANGFSSKTSFAWLIGFMTVFVYFLLLIIPFIDPKKRIQEMGNKYNSLKLITLTLMSVVSVFMIYNAISENANPQIFMLIMGIFFIVIGNYFQTTKQNYFMGIKTPWTLHSEAIWNKTHKISGKIWIIGGLIMCVTYLLLPFQYVKYINITILAIIVIHPFLYSYLLYRKEVKEL